MRTIWAEPLDTEAGIWKSYPPSERGKGRDGGRAGGRHFTDEVSTIIVRFKNLLKANRYTGERFEYGKKLMAAQKTRIESAVTMYSVPWRDLTLVLSSEYKLWKKTELMILDHLNLNDTYFIKINENIIITLFPSHPSLQTLKFPSLQAFSYTPPTPS